MIDVERDGFTLDVRDEGPRAGEVVVLLHGFPQDSRCWAEVTPTLHRAGLRTLAPDHVATPRPPAPRTCRPIGSAPSPGTCWPCWMPPACAARTWWNTWGGAVAWYLGAHHPERVDSLTVLSTPHPSALAHSMTRSLQPLRSWYTLAVQVPVLPAGLSRTLRPALRLSGLPSHLADRYARRFERPAALRGPLAWYRAAGRRPPWEVLDAFGAGSGDVAVPTTYVWGRRDPALGRVAAQATGDHVTGEYLFVELDAGHWLPELNPDEVAGAVLDRVRHVA